MRAGDGAPRAPTSGPLTAQRLCASTLRGTCTQWATTGAYDASRAATSARRGSGGNQPWGPCGTAPLFVCARGIPRPVGHRWGPCGAGHLGSHTRKHREASCGGPEDGGVWTAKTVKRPPQQPAQPQYANYWAPLTRKRHIPPRTAQPRHTNHWAPRTRKRHQQEHWPQWPTESSAPTQHAKGRAGDCPGPRKQTTTRRNVTQGGHLAQKAQEILGAEEKFSFGCRDFKGGQGTGTGVEVEEEHPGGLHAPADRYGSLPARGVTTDTLAPGVAERNCLCPLRDSNSVPLGQTSCAMTAEPRDLVLQAPEEPRGAAPIPGRCCRRQQGPAEGAERRIEGGWGTQLARGGGGGRSSARKNRIGGRVGKGAPVAEGMFALGKVARSRDGKLWQTRVPLTHASK